MARDVKMISPNINKSSIIILDCLVCNTQFGVLKRRYIDQKYCSKKCSAISRSNIWKDKSPYAKKIKELQKVYK